MARAAPSPRPTRTALARPRDAGPTSSPVGACQHAPASPRNRPAVKQRRSTIRPRSRPTCAPAGQADHESVSPHAPSNWRRLARPLAKGPSLASATTLHEVGEAALAAGSWVRPALRYVQLVARPHAPANSKWLAEHQVNRERRTRTASARPHRQGSRRVLSAAGGPVRRRCPNRTSRTGAHQTGHNERERHGTRTQGSAVDDAILFASPGCAPIGVHPVAGAACITAT